MKKMSKLVMAAILAVALQGTAMAAGTTPINLDSPTPGTVTLASELIKIGTTGADVVNATNSPFSVNATLGYSVSQSQPRSLRFDLGGGQFINQVTASDLAFYSGVTKLDSNNASITVSGGLPGQSYVVFEVTPLTTTALDQSTEFKFALKEFKKTENKTPATFTYSLYQFGYQAAQYPDSTGQYVRKVKNIVEFANALNFLTSGDTLTAEVSTQYKKFNDGTNKVLVGKLADLTLDVASKNTPMTPKNIITAAQYADIAALGTKLTLTGKDFTSASKVFIAPTGSACKIENSVYNATISGLTASFTTDTNVLSDAELCYLANGNTAIAEQKFTMATSITPQTNVEVTNITGQDAGAIIRNGTVLRAPFIEKSAFLHLTNTGSDSAAYTVTCFGPNDSAPETFTPAALEGNKTKKLWVGDLCGKTRTVNAVEFIIDAPSGTVTGSFVRQNASTGDTSVDTMTSK